MEAMAKSNVEELVLVTVRALSGEVLLGPRPFHRGTALQFLTSALLQQRKATTPPEGVSIFLGGAKLDEKTLRCGTESSIECHAVFAKLEVSDQERSACFQAIRQWRFKVLVFKAFSEAARADREIVLKAVEKAPSCLEYAGEACKDDREIVLKAVETQPSCLAYAGEACKNDREIVLKAVEKKPWCLRDAGEACKKKPWRRSLRAWCMPARLARMTARSF